MLKLTSHRLGAALLAVALGPAGPVAWAAGSGAVPTLELRPAAQARNFVAEATLEAVQQATVAAQVSGRILETRVDAGARVRKGEVLMRIDTREQDQAVAAAGAGKAAAEARLVEARASYERTRSLRDKNFISASALDQARAALDAAQAQVNAARAGQAQQEAGRSFATVTAPMDGIVAQRLAEVGDMAQPGRALLSVYAPGNLRAVADVPQARLAELAKPGLTARIELPEAGRWIEGGAVVLLPAADARTHTAQLRISLPPGAPGVLPGMAARVHVAVGEAPRLSLPAAAVLRRGEVTGVYVADGKGGFQLRQLRLGSPQEDGSLEVLAGLKGGETIALDPVRAGLVRR